MQRAIRLLALAGLVSSGLLVLPGVAEGLRPAMEFLAKSDAVGGAIPEQTPLLSRAGELSLGVGLRRMGGFVLLIPLVPFALLARRRKEGLEESALYLFGWSGLVATLAMLQVRYANDFAPVACVGFALLLGALASSLVRRAHWQARTGVFVAVGIGALLQAPTLPKSFGQHVAPSLRFLLDRSPNSSTPDRALQSVSGTQLRFAEMVRAATPEGPGCDGSGARPDYAILAPPSIGHALQYYAGRATPADTFGPYIGAENFEAARRFYLAGSEQQALEIAEKLDVRYVVTEEEGEALRSPVGQRLHRANGSAVAGRESWGRFRLLAEGPEGGAPTALLYGGAYRDTPPFKLFEIVPGARLEVPAEPGQIAVARVGLETPGGRRFEYRARVHGDPTGRAQLRLPYDTDGAGAVRARGVYRVVVGQRVWEVAVSEEQVRTSGRVPLPEPRSIFE